MNHIDDYPQSMNSLAGSSAQAALILSVAGKPLLKAYEATTFISRLRGLHAHLPLANNEALVISRCHAIHTITMRHPIDVVFVSETGEVIDATTVPVRRFRASKHATAVVEMNAGTCTRLGIGAGMKLERDSGVWK